jgi:hypothetical protein
MHINPKFRMGLIRAPVDEKMRDAKKETGGFYLCRTPPVWFRSSGQARMFDIG